MTKLELLERGRDVMASFCGLNSIPRPEVHPHDAAKWAWGFCAYYRPQRGIVICVPKCAAIGVAGRQWSYPGYTVDRTPYGVVQHELGHHVDVQRGKKPGAYWSEFSASMRGVAGEAPITSYCPNDAEWFAEMFRVYVTNPNLLQCVRPRTWRELSGCFQPVFTDSWRDRLKDAPARTLAAAERHIERVAA